MESHSLIKIPGYKYNEYLLVLDPHEELRDKIIEVKRDFANRYRANFSLSGKPYITLVNFIQVEIAEDRLVNCLTIIATGFHPIKVELKDFGTFPSHTIFINVDSKLQVQNLIKELKKAQQLMKLNKDNKPHFIDNPNVTIAGKLVPWQYEKAWLEYSRKEFTGRFIANHMLLIKKEVGEKKFEIVQRFEFMIKPCSQKQSELFV